MEHIRIPAIYARLWWRWFYFILFFVVHVQLSPFFRHHFPNPPTPTSHPQSFPALALSMGPLYMFLDDRSPSFPRYPPPWFFKNGQLNIISPNSLFWVANPARYLAMNRFCFHEGSGKRSKAKESPRANSGLISKLYRGVEKGIQISRARTLNGAFAKGSLHIPYIFACHGTKVITERQGKAGAAYLKLEPKEWPFSIRNTKWLTFIIWQNLGKTT